MIITGTPELYIMIFAFVLLFATVFIRHFMIYIAMIVLWLAIIFYPGIAFPDWIQLAAIPVIVYGLFSLNNSRKGSDKL